MQDSNSFGEIFTHRDHDGDPVAVGRDQAYGAYITQERGELKTTTYVKGAVPALARALYQAEGLRWGSGAALCGAFASPDPDTQYVCTRDKEHMGPHLDDKANTLWVSGWQHPGQTGYRFLDLRSDADKMAMGELPPAVPPHQCEATTATGSARVRCDLDRGHSADHNANGYTWPQTYADFRTRLPLCGIQLIWDRPTDGTAQCTLPAGHSGLHGLGTNSGDYLSGRMAEDVLMELLRRVSSLEQGRYADGPATDDMFAELRSALGEVEKRMTRQEGASTVPWQTLSEHMSTQTTAVLTKLDRLGAEPVEWVSLIHTIASGVKTLLEAVQTPELCGVGSAALNALGSERCELPAGHPGNHRMGITEWSQRQGLIPRTCADGSGEPWCNLPEGHTGLCRKRPSDWKDPEEIGRTPDAMDQVMDAGGHVYDERVRLQCDVMDWCGLGRGHEGDCADREYPGSPTGPF